MTGLKIAIFTGNYVHIKDGVSLTLNRTVAYLEKQGCSVYVYGPDVQEKVIEPAGIFRGVPSVPSPGRPEYRISLFLPEAYRMELETFNPDVVHIATPDILGLAGLRWAKKHKKPVISSYHTHFPSYLSYYNLGFLEGALWKYLLWFYGKCDKIVSPSYSMNQYLIKKGIPSSKIGLWTRGIETDLFTPDKRSQEWRNTYGFSADDVVVTFVSRLVWEKNLVCYVKAVQKAMSGNKHVKAMVVGDGPALEELRQMLPDAFYAGYREKEELALFYANSDIFFFPSESETFGNVTQEAAASGLPALVADAVGSKSIVSDEITGYVIPPHDYEGFADKILELASDAGKRAQMGTKAREMASQNSWDKVLSRLYSHYEELLKF
ncbi:MAG: glycosyltransferase family 1 protein [Balneolales bacterium]|nr:glycosyltransferase family 1 protein [Balneolales bacterium]